MSAFSYQMWPLLYLPFASFQSYTVCPSVDHFTFFLVLISAREGHISEVIFHFVSSTVPVGFQLN